MPSVVNSVLMRSLLINESINPGVPDRKGLRIHKVQQLGGTGHRTIDQLGKLFNLTVAEFPLRFTIPALIELIGGFLWRVWAPHE